MSNDPILQSKTLKRKNFKKLSLTSEKQTSSSTPVLATQVVAENESLGLYSLLSLTEKRNRLRSDNLVDFNLDLGKNSTSSTQPSPRQTSMAHQFSNLDLKSASASAHQSQTSLTSASNNFNNSSHSISASASGSTTTPQFVARKRQTVISSISPTKSITSIPSSISSANSASAQKLSFNIESSPLLEDSGIASSPLLTTSTLKLNNADLITLKDLGSGNSGVVSKILHVPSQKIMAKKIIHIDLKSIVQTQIIRELRILHECQSPFIIEFYGAFIHNNNTIVLCMEYCNCGSLDKILQLCDSKQFPTYVLKKLTYVMLSGLTYLFKTHKIVHRDIKPQNVLMNHKGEFKLCDFGVLRELKTLGMADTFVGTSYYMSPERIQGGNYGIKSDVWSIGIMLIELASGNQVWHDDDEDGEDGESKKDDEEGIRGGGPKCPEGILDLLQRIVNEKPPTLTAKKNPVTKEVYDPQLCKLIDSCLIKDDELRKSPWEMLDDDFMDGVEKGTFDKDVKSWAKKIRKLHKNKDDKKKA